MSHTAKSRLGLVALALIMFIVTLDTTITNIALPDITTYFKATLTDTNWISTIYVLVMSVAIIPASKFGDQFGHKKVMALGLILFGTGSILCGLSQNLVELIFMRLLQGLGGAIVTPIMIPLSVNLFGRQRANRAVGAIGAVTAVAAAAGPPIGGLILRFLTWPWIFFVNVPIVILTFVLLLLCFHESFDLTISKKVDFGGILFLTLSLTQLTFLLIKGYDMGWHATSSLALMGGSLVTLILFLITERTVQEPLIDFSLFKEQTFTASALVYLVCGFAIVCSSLVFNFYLENVRGYSALNASYIIMFMSITVMFSMPLGTRIVENYGYQLVITSGMALMALSLFLLTTLTPNTTNLAMIALMILLGIGFGFACLSIVSAVQFIPESKAGIASGIVNAARQLGTCLGIALLVGTMTHGVSTAKHSIKNQVAEQITRQELPSDLSHLLNHHIANAIASDNLGNRADTQTAFKKDVIRQLTSLRSNQAPQTVALKKIHIGLKTLNNQFDDQKGTISEAAKQITAGQRNLMAQNSAMLYQVIQDNPNGEKTLAVYRASYRQLLHQPVSKYRTRHLQTVSQMILVYEAGTNPTVMNSTSFTLTLHKLLTAHQHKDASQELIRAQTRLSASLSPRGVLRKKVTQLNYGVTRIDISHRINRLFHFINSLKQRLLTTAFTHTFNIAAWIIAVLTLTGLFTDKSLDPVTLRKPH